VREHTTGRNLAATIRKLLDEKRVYTNLFKQVPEIYRHIHNVFFYWISGGV